MNSILNIGRYLFPLSFLLYVGLHFGQPDVEGFLRSCFYTVPFVYELLYGSVHSAIHCELPHW